MGDSWVNFNVRRRAQAGITAISLAYLGKYYLSLGDKDSATALFKLAVANNVHNYVEHRYALLELSLLGQEQDDLAESDQQ